MTITSSEEQILIKGYGRFNQTLRFVYSNKHGGWMVDRRQKLIITGGFTKARHINNSNVNIARHLMPTKNDK